MKRSVMAGLTGHLIALLLLLPRLSVAQEVIRFMPQWTPQTQFAGYYVAMEKGFYAEEGVQVIMDHFGGSSTGTAIEKIAHGKTDIITSQLVSAMIAREHGLRLVNVLQTSQVNGLMCVCRRPVDHPQALDSAKLGRWKVGFGEVCDIFCLKNGLHVDWIPFIQGINLFVAGAVDGVLCYSYNEYFQVVLATGGIPKENIVRFRDYGLDYPEDGLYVTERYYKRHKDAVDKFVKASKRGWDYAREHPDEALAISMRVIQDYNVVTNITLQKMMLEEILALQVNPETGRADYAPVRRPVFEDMNASLREAGHLTTDIKYEDLIR